MIVLAGYLAILALVVLHESLHALIGRHLGMRVVEAGLGMPKGPRKSWQWHGMTWTLSPLLIGAFVRWDAETERVAGRRRMALMYLAGPVANIAAGVVIWELLLLLMGAQIDQVSHYVIELSGASVGATAGAFGAMLSDPIHSPIGGILMIGWAFAHADTALFFWAMVAGASFIIGLINLIPVIPFDGGMALSGWVPRLRGKLALGVTLFAIVVLMVIPNVLDVIRLLTGGFAQ